MNLTWNFLNVGQDFTTPIVIQLNVLHFRPLHIKPSTFKMVKEKTLRMEQL